MQEQQMHASTPQDQLKILKESVPFVPDWLCFKEKCSKCGKGNVWGRKMGPLIVYLVDKENNNREVIHCDDCERKRSQIAEEYEKAKAQSLWEKDKQERMEMGISQGHVKLGHSLKVKRVKFGGS